MAARPPARALAALLAAAVLALAGSVGDAPARSSAGPMNNGQPTITGVADLGETLTGHNGSWWCDPPYRDPDTGAVWESCKYDFQWQRCPPGGGCTDIEGAAEQEYDVTPADAGNALRVGVTATNYDCNAHGVDCRYSSATAYSAATAVVPGAPPDPLPPPPTDVPPIANALPIVAGSPVQGRTLTASPGDWTGTRPMHYTYAWSRCLSSCSPIAGAREPGYVVGAADVGSALRVAVTATNVMGSATAISEPTAVVGPVPELAPVSMSAPAVFGSPKEGSTLTAVTGSWNGSPAPTFSFGWLRCERESGLCLPIEGADGANYVLRAEDAGRMLRAVVTASNAAGTATATSPPTRVVDPAGVLHLLDGRESVPASSVAFPDHLRVDSTRFTTRDGRTIRGTVHVSDSRGYVVRGAVVSIRPARKGEISNARRATTSTAGSATVSFAVGAARRSKGGNLVLVLRATRRGDDLRKSVAASVRITLPLRPRA